MIIGIDPHKLSHTATAVDPATNTATSSLRVSASLAGYRELLGWPRGAASSRTLASQLVDASASVGALSFETRENNPAPA
jgi:hypothetical protein